MPPIDRLTAEDLDACLALATGRGWRPERRRWRLLFAAGEVYGVRAGPGELAGCVSLARYGTGLAAVGMMLVAERFGRQGLGRALMEHVLAEAGDATIFLYATPFGRPLYERLGFRTVGAATTCIGPFIGAAAGASRAATEADRAAIAALDVAAFGADRGPLLRGFFAFAEQLRVVERDGAVSGYGAAATRAGTTIVGPVVAPDLDAGRALIADLAAPVDGHVRLDIDNRDGGLLAWAAEHGVAPGDVVTLMVHGDRDLPGDRERLLLPLMLAVG
jgi:GNAT superfamily N-acetyltransferase